MSVRPVFCPSILSFDPADFRTPVSRLDGSGASWVHLDVMDGQFVPPITFGADLAASLGKSSRLPLEAHLMTATPDAHFDAFVGAGCRRITFHIEATNHAHRLAQSLREKGVEAGVALNPATPVESVINLLGTVGLVLVMTVNPGWGGQRLIDTCVEKVAAIRAHSPEIPIQVDGGVGPSTVARLWEAGATHFVTGSYLAKTDDFAAAIKELDIRCR